MYVWISGTTNLDNFKYATGVNITPAICNSTVLTERKLNLDLETKTRQINISVFAKLLFKANKHARSAKTSKYLKLAITKLLTDLNDQGQRYELATERSVGQSISTCKEEFKGEKYGFPIYETGFEVENCKIRDKHQDIVTIILIGNYPNLKFVQKLLSSFSEARYKYRVLMSLNPEPEIYTSFEKTYPFLKIINFKAGETRGKRLNTLLKMVVTDYILIGEDIEFFYPDARLDRLVREIERLNISVAGGAARDSEGHWKLGCHQMSYVNFTIQYQEGYDESIHECIFCDYVDGPFVIKSKIAKRVLFDENLVKSGLFEDFFIRLGVSGFESVICADSMFYVHSEHRMKEIENSESWTDFATKYQLYRLIFSSGNIITFNCLKGLSCTRKAGFVLHPCCIIALSHLVISVLDTCSFYDIVCEIAEGTNLGAVKTGKVLPWDFEGDIFFSSEYSSFISNNFGSKLAEKGLSLNKLKDGNFTILSKHLFVDFYGKVGLTSTVLKLKNIKQTKINLYGTWVGSSRNPGLSARNRYGHEIYRHAEHWRSLGYKHGHSAYHPGTFTSCPVPGNHNCIDLHDTDGNIQFQGKYP